MRKINVSRPINTISESFMACILQSDVSKVFHEIEFVGEARATDGPASLVRLTSRTDFPPDVDVACLIHIRSLEQTHLDADARMIAAGFELWYWQNRFWVKGVNSLGIEYYTKIVGQKCYALCPIEVVGGDQLLAKIA